MRYPFASIIISEIAPSLGIVVELEPEYGFAGELIFPDGRRHLFRNTNFNVNPAGSTEIAKDKGYTSYFLRKHGFNVPTGKAFFSDQLNQNLPADRRRGIPDAVAFAKKLGFPLFAKPNNLSQGVLVTKVYNAAELRCTAHRIFERTAVMLVEEACFGRDYRVVVLGDKIISAYERIPLSVRGNGVDSVDKLLKDAKEKLSDFGRPNAEIDPTDPRIDIKLGQLKLLRNSVIPEGESVFLLDNANLSTGGTSSDVTGELHPSFAAIAIHATKTIGLQLSGVDLLCNDISRDAADQVWNIIEINAAPGLDNYASLGDDQNDRVKGLYREVLEYLATHHT